MNEKSMYNQKWLYILLFFFAKNRHILKIYDIMQNEDNF